MQRILEHTARWRQAIRDAELTPEATRMAFALADHYIGYGEEEDPLGKVLGTTQQLAAEFVRTLQESGFVRMVGDPSDTNGEGFAYQLLIPNSDTPCGKETLLYHYYDNQGVLLYIGITNSLPRRQSSHEAKSTWMDFAARSTMERFPSREAALAVEKVSIEIERPLFNVEHNDRPDRVRRIVDYLIDRDRRDLLVPLISRG